MIHLCVDKHINKEQEPKKSVPCLVLKTTKGYQRRLYSFFITNLNKFLNCYSILR